MADAAERWQEIVRLPEDELALDEAALLIAAHTNPKLDIASQLRRLDDLADSVGEASLDRLLTVIFDTYGLRGDRETYDDPRNSYLDQVLDRRLGIPISLSVILIEVGRRCGIPLEGVGMPGHFLVRDPSASECYLDVFDGGRRLHRQDCAELLRSMAGADAHLTPMMLENSGHRAILMRMLANLARSFARRSDRNGLVWATRLQVMIPDLPVGLRTSLADQLGDLGCFHEAADLLSELAALHESGDEQSRQLENRATAIRARLN